MLERDAVEANGNIRRMLSVCSEFERIAKVVLDKAERDMRGRGKRKQAEREKEKDRKDGNSIAAGLDEGKTLEMMQVETQAAYRRPIQTPSLRHSMEGSQQPSPASWGSSPAGGTGPEYKTPGGTSTTSDGNVQRQQRQASQAQPPTSNSGHLDPNSAYAMQDGFGTSVPYQQQNFGPNSQSPPQAPPFSQAGLTMDGSLNPASTGFSPSNQPMGLDMNGAADFNTSPDMAGGIGSFQQPFVPQDLWQMPMTLEWDWAEGLGLGSFTPGPMFDYGLEGTGVDVEGLGDQLQGGGQ